MAIPLLVLLIFLLLCPQVSAFTVTRNQHGARDFSTFTTTLNMGVVGSVSSRAKRIRDSLLSKPRSNEDLKIGIAGFYDRSSQLWEDVWGEVRI